MPIDFGLIIHVIMSVLLMHTLLTKKKGWLYCVIVFLLNTLLASFCVRVSNSLFVSPEYTNYGAFITGFIYLIYICLVFKESFAIKIFTMLSIRIVTTISIYLAGFVGNSFLHLTENLTKELSIIKFIFQTIFMLILYFLVRKKYQEVLQKISYKTIYLMSIYPLLGLVVLVNNYDYNKLSIHNMKILMPSFFLIMFIVWGYILVFSGIYSAKKNIELNNNIELLMNQVKLQQDNYVLINESIQKSHALKHDMRHHISILKTMLRDEKINEAQNYMDKFNNQIIENNIPIICTNYTIDSLLKYYLSCCIANQIDFKIELNISEAIKIDDLDLCVVLGNCIENAIEACEKITKDNEKFIILASESFGENIVFKMKNSFNGIIEKNSDNHIKSSKGDRLGIGLTNVKQVVSKYKGSFEIKYSESVFEVCIVL